MGMAGIFDLKINKESERYQFMEEKKPLKEGEEYRANYLAQIRKTPDGGAYAKDK